MCASVDRAMEVDFLAQRSAFPDLYRVQAPAYLIQKKTLLYGISKSQHGEPSYDLPFRRHEPGKPGSWTHLALSIHLCCGVSVSCSRSKSS